MNNPKISVVIPIYNVGPYLEAALRSVMNQTFEDLEIILVNDGSTDRSVDIIQSLASEDPRIKVISQKNQGQATARNNGIAAARAPYVSFLDGDDILEKEALKDCYDVCEKDHLDFVFFDAESFGSAQSGEPWFDYLRAGRYPGIYKGTALFKKMLEDGVYRSSVCLNLIRMDFLNKNSIRFYPGIIHEDELFTAKIYLSAKRVESIPKVLYRRRLRADSTMTTSFSMRNVDGYMTVFRELIKFANEQSVSEQLVTRLLISTILPTMMSNAWALKWNERVRIVRIAIKYYAFAVKALPIIKLLFKKPIKKII
jgi:glycosyltransferase involved in cell wall biosynthesis